MTTATRCKLHLSLNAPDITPMIGAGIGGLAMTLRQLNLKFPSPEIRLGNLSWWVTDSSIRLDWQGQDFDVLDWLLRQSFQIDDKGLIALTGLNPTAIELSHRIHLHQAIKATFLRLNKFYKVGEDTTESVTVDGFKGTLKYKKIEWYAHQTFARQLCDESGQLLRDYLQIVSWLHLGATVRHARLDRYNKLEEKPEYAFALLFVPVICQYFILHSNSEKSDNRQLIKYVVVIPEVTNLEDAAHRRENLNSLNYTDFYVASLGEAALKYYSFDEVTDSYRENCQVLLYEKLNKKSQQRTLFQSQDVEINTNNITLYQLAHQQLQKNRIFVHRKDFTVKVNPIRGMIADNLVQGNPWWSNFWDIFIGRDVFGDLAKELVYNRRGLKAMIDHDEEMEVYQAFIEAFHEALRNIYAKIYSRTEEGDAPRIEREYERIRGEISRCYDDQSYRDFISEFLARAGLNEALYSQWKPILPLIMESVSWQKGRNLALLALASYEPKKKLHQIPSQTPYKRHNPPHQSKTKTMYYLFGTLLTRFGSASLNHGQRKGNISPLQKCQWSDDKLHSMVNADAIRWALRYYWQLMGYPVNRIWDADIFDNHFIDENFDPEKYIDDDVLGFMKTEAAKEEIIEGENLTSSATEDNQVIEKKRSKQTKGKKKQDKPKGDSIQRMGVLGVNRAISLIPYNGTITFNSKSGEKNRTSLHFIEYHNTRYQYVFALDPNHLKDKNRILSVIDALMSIRKVGGHNNVSCYDFSPESFILRWTQKTTPQLHYCFEQSRTVPQINKDLIEEIKAGDIDAQELWIGGKIAENTEIEGANISRGKEKVVANLKQVIAKDLNLTFP